MHMLGGAGKEAGQPADKGKRGRNEGGKLGSGPWWATQPIDKGSSPPPPVGSDRNNGELGSGDGHRPFVLLAWGLLLIRRIGSTVVWCR